MIRFHCPLCDKTLKTPEQKAGATVLCPRCKERSVVPLTGDGSDGRAADSGAGGRSAAHAHGGEAPPLFPAMTQGGRWALRLAAGAAILSLLLAIVVPFLPALAAAGEVAKSAAMILIPCCTVVVLAVLYGAATGCPSCNRWWTRRPAEKEFVDREVFEKDGEPFARSIYRTNYECTACRRRWSATSADEYKEFVRHDRPRQRLG